MNEKVDPESSVKSRVKRPVQVGILVKDLERTTRLLGSLFGLGPLHFIEWPNHWRRVGVELWGWPVSPGSNQRLASRSSHRGPRTR